MQMIKKSESFLVLKNSMHGKDIQNLLKYSCVLF